MNFSNKGIGTLGDHPYITSAKILGGWVRKMAIFANVQYFMYADIVVGTLDLFASDPFKIMLSKGGFLWKL